MKNIRMKTFTVLVVKFSIYLNRRVFVIPSEDSDQVDLNVRWVQMYEGTFSNVAANVLLKT